jgi:hypothetical protein
VSTFATTLHTRAGRSLAALTTTGLLATAGAFLAPGTALAGTPTTVDFSCTGAAQTWTVPTGVSSATFTLDGASGGQGAGHGYPAAGGKGGELLATLPVTAGDSYSVLVGCQGANGSDGVNSAGGFNGGGPGGSYNGFLPGGGGGGATDIRHGGTGLTDRILVAGGGGGSSSSGEATGTTIPAAAAGGAGSGANDAGPGADGADGGGAGGAQGTSSGGGAGGPATVGHAGEGGSFGAGGSGGQAPNGDGGSGGGGGGWYGGGGGAGSTTSFTAGGGGGGGAGYAISTATAVTVSTGVHAGDGQVLISYVPAAPVTSAPTVSGTPGDGTVGSPYSFAFTTTGAPAPTCSVTGDLPPGIRLDATTCSLWGTPTAGGAYPVTVTASNGTAPDDAVDVTVTVAQPPSLSDVAIPVATVGQSYSYQLPLVGYPTPTVSLTAGTLPDGLTLDSSGLLHGTPTATGATFGLGLHLASSAGAADYTEEFVVDGVAPVLTSGTPDDVVVGRPYRFQFTGSGGPGLTFAIAAGPLPAGLSLDPTTGVLSGTSTVLGDYPITVQAANVWGGTQASYTLHVTGTAPSIAKTPPPAEVGLPYSFAFDSGASNPAPTYTVTSGTLPLGLTLSGAGVIAGTPQAVGPGTPVTITASNGVGPDASVTVTIPVTAQPPVTPVGISGTPVSARVREPYTYTFVTTGDPVVRLAAGRLPTGLHLAPSGVLSGTPTRAGRWTFTVRATGDSGASASEQVSLQVLAPPRVTITGGSAREGDSGSTPVTFTVSLSRPSTVPVTVRWATRNGTARAGSDYAGAHGVITFAPGQTEQLIVVEVDGDRRRERDEQFRVVLSHAWHAWLHHAIGVGRIQNDD